MIATSSKNIVKSVHSNLGQPGYLLPRKNSTFHYPSNRKHHSKSSPTLYDMLSRHPNEHNPDDEPYDDPFIKDLFKLPYEERIVKDFSGWFGSVFRACHIYLTSNYFCYRLTNQTDTEDKIPWKSIQRISKSSTRKVIPNAIIVATEQKELCFAFLARNRNKYYRKFVKQWYIARGLPPPEKKDKSDSEDEEPTPATNNNNRTPESSSSKYDSLAFIEVQGLEPIRDTPIESVYTFKKDLGSGAFATVKLGVHNETGAKRAVKVISKKNVHKDKREMLRAEIDIMSRLNHNNIIQMFEVFDAKEALYIVMELATGGDLFKRIESKGAMPEKEAAKVIFQVASAVAYLHSVGVAHRDLKPENILFSDPSEDAQVKIVDFGVSKIIQHNSKIQSVAGTPDYVAPEVLKGEGHDFSVDCWAIGCILYTMLCGYGPFQSNSDLLMMEKIMKAKYSFSGKEWEHISQGAKDLISHLLVLDPQGRISAEDILKHEWIAQHVVTTFNLEEVKQKVKEFNVGHLGFGYNVLTGTLTSQIFGNLDKFHSVVGGHGLQEQNYAFETLEDYSIELCRKLGLDPPRYRKTIHTVAPAPGKLRQSPFLTPLERLSILQHFIFQQWEHYYSVNISEEIPLAQVLVESAEAQAILKDELRFTDETKAAFFKLFQTYGTHFVSTVKFGNLFEYYWAVSRDRKHKADKKIRELFAEAVAKGKHSRFKGKAKLVPDEFSHDIEEHSAEVSKPLTLSSNTGELNEIGFEITEISAAFPEELRDELSKALVAYISEKSSKQPTDLPYGAKIAIRCAENGRFLKVHENGHLFAECTEPEKEEAAQFFIHNQKKNSNRVSFHSVAYKLELSRSRVAQHTSLLHVSFGMHDFLVSGEFIMEKRVMHETSYLVLGDNNEIFCNGTRHHKSRFEIIQLE